jgi:hypothetical protein
MDLHAFVALAATAAAGLLMTRTGLDKRLLALRSPVRRCGTCGRRLRRDTCHSCR